MSKQVNFGPSWLKKSTVSKIVILLLNVLSTFNLYLDAASMSYLIMPSEGSKSPTPSGYHATVKKEWR
jgi:hypothetical protein